MGRVEGHRWGEMGCVVPDAQKKLYYQPNASHLVIKPDAMWGTVA